LLATLLLATFVKRNTGSLVAVESPVDRLGTVLSGSDPLTMLVNVALDSPEG